MKISALKAQAKVSLKGNWGLAILIMLVVFAISSAVDSLTAGLGALVTPVLTFGVASFYMIIARGGSAKLETVFTDSFSNFLKKWGALLLTGLYVWLWSLLFIIPGIVMSYAYSMTQFLMLDNPEMGVTEAIAESKKMMKGNKWKLFCLDLSFIGWHLLAFLTCGLVYIYAIPLMNAARVQFYLELKGEKAAEAEEAAEAAEEPVAETQE